MREEEEKQSTLRREGRKEEKKERKTAHLPSFLTRREKKRRARDWRGERGAASSGVI